MTDQQPRTKEAATMNDTNERSAASAGSQEPVAWALIRAESGQCVSLFFDYPSASATRLQTIQQSGICHDLVALYRHQQHALTNAEREAVEASREFWQVEADCAMADETDQRYAATLDGLLKRFPISRLAIEPESNLERLQQIRRDAGLGDDEIV